MKQQKNSIARQDEGRSRDRQGVPSREELEQHVRARAWKDEAFRQEFQANPKAVLERDYTQWFPEGKLPSDLSIKVIEEEEQTICFVLPPRFSGDYLPKMEDLDEEALVGLSAAIGAAVTRDCSAAQTCRLANCDPDLRGIQGLGSRIRW